MNPTESDYKKLFLIFYRVANFIEGNSKDEDVKIMFQSAKILEGTCSELEKIGAIERFGSKLREFWSLKGLKVVPLDFFKKASDHVLSRYIVDSTFSDSVVHMAIHQFVINKSEREFHELAQKLVNTHKTVEILRKTYYSPQYIEQYRAEQYLEKLRQALIKNQGDVEEMHSEIVKSISNCNDLFNICLKMLCLSSVCDIILNIQDVVALSLNKLLSDNININLWCYFCNLSEQDFHKIVSKWCDFIDAFLQSVRISVEKLQCDYSENTCSWVNKGSDSCLSFDQIVMFFNRSKGQPGINKKIKEFLQQIGDEGFRLVVEDIIQKCKIR